MSTEALICTSLSNLPSELRKIILQLLFESLIYVTTCSYCKRLTRLGNFKTISRKRFCPEKKSFIQTKKIKSRGFITARVSRRGARNYRTLSVRKIW